MNQGESKGFAQKPFESLTFLGKRDSCPKTSVNFSVGTEHYFGYISLYRGQPGSHRCCDNVHESRPDSDLTKIELTSLEFAAAAEASDHLERLF